MLDVVVHIPTLNLPLRHHGKSLGSLESYCDVYRNNLDGIEVKELIYFYNPDIEYLPLALASSNFGDVCNNRKQSEICITKP